MIRVSALYATGEVKTLPTVMYSQPLVQIGEIISPR
jgi:hypothetical protein